MVAASTIADTKQLYTAYENLNIAQRVYGKNSEQAKEATKELDAVLTPTTLTPAIPIASIDQNTTPGMATRWVNFLDLCALAVPNGFSAGGLPLSLQIVCSGYNEAMALRIGWAWEQSTDWQAMKPAMVG